MTTINKKEYEVILSRIEKLLEVVDNNTSEKDPNMVELNLLSKMAEEYEEVHFPISKPSLSEVMKLRMYEMGLSQKSLAGLLGVSPSRISEFISGKSEPTLGVARNISKALNIPASVILGV